MQEAEHPFNLEQGQVLRVKLVMMGAEGQVLLYTMHHIASDGWSMEVLVKEFGLLYQAMISGERSPLRELAVQYGDFAAWQRGWLKGAVLEEQLKYWRGQLAGAPAVMDLPLDRARGTAQEYAGESVEVKVMAEQRAGLESLGRQEGATLFMTLLATYQVLLWRYTGQERVVVGTPVANRNRGELEGLIGFFVNPLVMHTDLRGEPTFVEVLKRVREVALGAYTHQDLPFERLVEELQPRRDLSYDPLYQVGFLFERERGRETMSVGGVELEGLECGMEVAKSELTLALRAEAGGGVRGRLQYRPGLFERGTVERMARHWERLVEEIVREGRKPITELRWWNEGEREQILNGWNETQAEYPRETLVHQLFEAQAARTPEAVALKCGKAKLTYRELNQRANGLAGWLRKQRVESEELVGLCVERGLDMIVGLLGVLKAGCAYVPMDPVYPKNRLEFMVNDARIRVLITDPTTRPKLEVLNFEGEAPALLCISSPAADESDCDVNPSTTISQSNTAYMIYTSGSTGNPKGVQVVHGAVVNFLLSMRERPGISSSDKLLAVTTLSFDIAVLEIYLPLIVGATVVVATRETVVDAQKLAEEMDGGITFMQATPATWRLLFDSGWKGNPRLKVLCGGESLPADLAGELLEKTGELWNMYGPTETTVWSTLERIIPGKKIYVGRPIANTEVYILDSYGRPVPEGVPGELYLGGAGLARGYLGRPDLTAEKFIPHPFSQKGGERIYFTGDLARYDTSGRIECLGRVDQQVKVRGFRIELGEIEEVLRRQPGIREAVVVVREQGGGDRRLVGYVTWEQAPAQTARQLRQHLQSQLPEHLIPTALVYLKELPLTANGKLDRKALPAPEVEPLESRRASNPVEEELVRIWEEALGRKGVGITDNFFDLGGHSLLAMKLVSAVRERLGLELPLPAVFQGDFTIETVARRVVQQRIEQADQQELEQAMKQLEELSEEEAQAMLGSESEPISQ
jgi:amino acid adenylation domain-containing protein